MTRSTISSQAALDVTRDVCVAFRLRDMRTGSDILSCAEAVHPSGSIVLIHSDEPGFRASVFSDRSIWFALTAQSRRRWLIVALNRNHPEWQLQLE
jgi:hypothetical protein